MALTTLKLPANAQGLFERKAVRLEKGSFEQYKEWAERDKSLLPIYALNDRRDGIVWRSLMMSLREIDSANSRAAFERLASICDSFTKNIIPSESALHALESSFKAELSSSMPFYQYKLETALSSRSECIFRQIEPFLEGSRLLDIGAGNGLVAKLVHEKKGMQVELIDVVDYNKSGLPLYTFDGENIPFPDRSFDTAQALMVFHHADRPLRLIEEAARVSSRRVLVIESVKLNEAQMRAGAFSDWFYNRVLNDGVNCPYNFQTIDGWVDTFARFGLKTAQTVHLGIDMPLAPEYHVLFVLEKQG